MLDRVRVGRRPARQESKKLLFVAGCQRSGTTAFADYLNRHPSILVCQERYKFLDESRLTPELFTFERILTHLPGETDAWRAEQHATLLRGKDATRIQWIGDKNPRYVRCLETLAANNPGAQFIVLFRPLEEVAESFAARAADPHDHWPSENGFAVGVSYWNKALESTRRFVESGGRDRLLLIDYHRFFGNPASMLPLLSSFLDVEFDEGTRETWARISSEFARNRRTKLILSHEQRALIEAQKDRALEDWAVDFLAVQPALRLRSSGKDVTGGVS